MLESVFMILDYLGVAVFAVSGALAAARARMDVFGFIVAATVTGVGGGTLRDLLLGAAPVFWVESSEYVLICFGVAVFSYFVLGPRQRRGSMLVWMDAVGIAVFCVLGAQRAFELEANPTIAVAMGGMTAVFGGVARDLLCGEVPLILRREIYATAAFFGAGMFVFLDAMGVSDGISEISGCLVCFIIRAVAVTRGLGLPVHRGRPEDEDSN